MKTLIALIVLVGLALVGSRRTFVTRRLPFGGRMVFTGSEFIIIGLLLGSEYLNLIDENARASLRPFVCVTLGWIGFLFGSLFDRRTLRQLPSGFLAIAGTEALVTMAAVFAVFLLLLGQRSNLEGEMLSLAAATLAASAACTGQTALALVGRHGRRLRSRQLMNLFRYVSSLDPAVGVTAFGVALAFCAPHPLATAGLIPSLQWLVISVCLGCITAWIFVSITLTRTSQSELGLFLLGTVALCSGIALYFGLSMLFVTFVSGLVVANLTQVGSIRGRVIESMVRGERFLYILLLVLAGSSWVLPSRWALSVAALYLGVRLLGKVLGTYVATRGLAQRQPVPTGAGLGLASQAGMGLAIIIDFQLVAGGAASDAVASVAILAIIVNELMAPWLILGVVGRSKEATP